MTSEGTDHDIERTAVTRPKYKHERHNKVGTSVRDFEGLIGVFNLKVG
jgi:hypothetical protein